MATPNYGYEKRQKELAKKKKKEEKLKNKAERKLDDASADAAASPVHIESPRVVVPPPTTLPLSSKD